MGTKNNPGQFDCYEHADPDEPMFVLLARDRCAPEVVRTWATMRENKLRASDVTCTPGEVMAELDQIAEARRCADLMEVWRDSRKQWELSQKRMGAMAECGCWWADPPGAIERGHIAECPFHGTVGIREVNVRLMSGDDGYSEWISGAEASS